MQHLGVVEIELKSAEFSTYRKSIKKGAVFLLLLSAPKTWCHLSVWGFLKGINIRVS